MCFHAFDVVNLYRLATAGPVSSQQVLLLRLCMDALRATAVLPQADLARLSAAVDNIAGLAGVQDAMRQVGMMPHSGSDGHALKSGRILLLQLEVANLMPERACCSQRMSRTWPLCACRPTCNICH